MRSRETQSQRAAEKAGEINKLAPLLTWAVMMLWQLDHPHSKARREITAEHMQEKLGWLKTFTENIRS